MAQVIAFRAPNRLGRDGRRMFVARLAWATIVASLVTIGATAALYSVASALGFVDQRITIPSVLGTGPLSLASVSATAAIATVGAGILLGVLTVSTRRIEVLSRPGHRRRGPIALDAGHDSRTFTGSAPDDGRDARSRVGREPWCSREAGDATDGRLGMTTFEPHEIAFLQSGRRLARIATVGRDGTPHVVPVGWSYNPETDTIDVGGNDFAGTKKYRDVARTGRAAIVIDEVLPPWNPRGIEVRGAAEALEGPPALIRIHPDRVRSWGLDTEPDAR